jgi:hypothetical protein
VHPGVNLFRNGVDEKYSTWSNALENLPHKTAEQQLHLGRCFKLFKDYFSGTQAWKLFFIRNAQKPQDRRQLSERSVDAMMAAARLYDWAEKQRNGGDLQETVVVLMGRGQNYGLLGLAALATLPQRYWRRGLVELKAVGEARRTRGDHRWRDRTWRMAILSEDVLTAMAGLERPSRDVRLMLERPEGYDRIVSDRIREINQDEKIIPTVSVRKIMHFLAEDVRCAENRVANLREKESAAQKNAELGLGQLRFIMSLPDERRKVALEKIARGIAAYYADKNE